MTPTPPGSRWETLAGNGLTSSKTRKRTKPTTAAAGVSGTASIESVMPATSSTTMAPGSLPRDSACSASPAAQVPTTVAATKSATRTTGVGAKSQRPAMVSALATVPGASGARPTPPTVATATARRVRTATLGALADELVAVDLDDADAREVPGAEVAAAAQVDDAVDLRRLAGGAALPVERGVLAGTIDQHVHRCPHLLARPLPGEGVLRLLDARRALGRHLGLDLPGVARRRRALLGRVGEDAEAVEAHLVDELQQPLEGRLVLAREADQHGGAHRDAGHGRPELGDHVAHAPGGDGAPHRFQDPVVGVLDRHVEIRHDACAGPRRHQPVVDVGGVEVHRTDPRHAGVAERQQQ